MFIGFGVRGSVWNCAEKNNAIILRDDFGILWLSVMSDEFFFLEGLNFLLILGRFFGGDR